MKMIILTVIITLVVHSVIGTALYILTNENEDFIIGYGIGIVGMSLCGLLTVKRKFDIWYKYKDKRSIFEDEDGSKYYCEIKYAKDFDWHYDVVKRYADKVEWENLTPFTKEQIEFAKRNCDRCKYQDDCTFDMFRKSLDRVRCEHDVYGYVTKFDKFEEE